MSNDKNYFVKLRTASGDIYVKDLEAWTAIRDLQSVEENGVAFLYCDTTDDIPTLAGGNLTPEAANTHAVYLVPPITGNLTLQLVNEDNETYSVTLYNISSTATTFSGLAVWLYNNGYQSSMQMYTSISASNVASFIFGIYSTDGAAVYLKTATEDKSVTSDDIQQVLPDWSDILTMYKSTGEVWNILGNSADNKSIAEIATMVNTMAEKLNRITEAEPVEVENETLKITDVQFAKILPITGSSE